MASVDGVFHVWLPAHVGRITPTKNLWPPGFGEPGRVEYHNTPRVPEVIRTAPGPVVAHNANKFDKHIWDNLIGGDREWIDTLLLARAGGYPGGLDKLGKLIYGQGKDDGKKFLDKLMNARYRDGWEYPPPHPGYVTEVLRYNVGDVILLKEIYERVKDYGEPELIHLDRKINDRGVHFDPALADTIIRLSTTNISVAMAEIKEITGGALPNETALRSHVKMKDWLASHKVILPDMQQKTVERFLDDPEIDEDIATDAISPVVFDVLRLRQAVMRVTSSKLERALAALSSDSRMRDVFEYYGAHTGRWSSRGVQVHNLTKGKEGLDVGRVLTHYNTGSLDFSALQSLRAPETTTDDVLSLLIRPCFTAEPGKSLLIADYNAIEARCVAWLAGQQNLLDTFASHGDPYCDMAGDIFGRKVTKADKAERKIAKPVVLGCGYMMGEMKMAATMAKDGIDLVAAGVTPNQLIQAYRNRFPDIAGTVTGNWNGRPVRKHGLWHKVMAAAMQVVTKGGETSVARCIFFREGNTFVIRLPSGRQLYYRNARIEDVVPGYCKVLNLPEIPKPTIVYDSPRGDGFLSHGGKITENICQAICRDLLAAAMFRVEDAGLPIVLHVHDELVAEGEPADITILTRLMSVVPTWAKGFPITVEGYSSKRYVKTPIPGSIRCEMTDGKEV